MSDRWRIKEVAHRSGLSPATIRYYESIGLVPPPARNESGYRLYSADDLARLDFVRRAKLLGLSLAEIGEIVTYAAEGRCNPLQAHLWSLLQTKIAEIDQRIQELHHLRAEFETYCERLSPYSPRTSQVEHAPDAEFCACLNCSYDGHESPGPSMPLVILGE